MGLDDGELGDSGCGVGDEVSESLAPEFEGVGVAVVDGLADVLAEFEGLTLAEEVGVGEIEGVGVVDGDAEAVGVKNGKSSSSIDGTGKLLPAARLALLRSRSNLLFTLSSLLCCRSFREKKLPKSPNCALLIEKIQSRVTIAATIRTAAILRHRNDYLLAEFNFIARERSLTNAKQLLK